MDVSGDVEALWQYVHDVAADYGLPTHVDDVMAGDVAVPPLPRQLQARLSELLAVDALDMGVREQLQAVDDMYSARLHDMRRAFLKVM